MARVVALDPGTKRVGVAVSDSTQSMAFPRPSLEMNDSIGDQVRSLVTEEQADTVVVGRPLSLAGTETASTAMADAFRTSLAVTLGGVDVVAVDERLTTVTAQQRLSSAGVSQRAQRAIVDSAAAVVLLQAYLDAQSS